MAALGLFMAALAPILMFLAGLIWGLDISGDAIFFLGTAAIGLIGGFVVLRFNAAWAKVVGIVASILIGGALFWTAFGLFAPMSFFDFTPGLLVIPGAIMGLSGSIAALVAKAGNKAAVAPADGERKTVKIVPAIVAVLAVISAVFTFVGKETVDEGAADEQVTLSDFEYTEESYSFAGGTKVLVRNDDPFLHTFTVEELDIDEVLSPGSEILVDIPSEAGDYIVFCQPHTTDPDDPSEDDMAADLTIE
jgi:hypothetical protein